MRPAAHIMGASRMKSFASEMGGRVIIIRMDRGEDLLKCIKQTIAERNITDATLVCGYGTLSDCRMHMVTSHDTFPAGNEFPEWHASPFEIASMTGVIAEGNPHIHMCVAMGTTTYAGHLEEGCLVSYVGEVVLYEHRGLTLKRVPTEWEPGLEGPEHLDD